MSSLFTDRVRIAIADACPVGLSRAYDERAARSSMALQGHVDIPLSARGDIAIAVATKCEDQFVQGRLLRAFWTTYGGDHHGLPVAARLWVNAPASVAVAEEYSYTHMTQGWLTGIVGTVLAAEDLHSPLVVSTINGETPGYFDDVTLFWDRGLDPGLLAPLLAPQSTVTLVRPRPDKHSFWMGWADLDLNFNALFAALEIIFKVVPLSTVEQEETLISVFGLEFKSANP